MRRTLRFVLLAAACLGLPAAFVAPGSARAEGPSTFAYADNGYAELDPAHASLYRLNDERLITAVQECLTVLDPATGKAKAGAAASWSASPDGHTWTFDLRKTAKWSDGSPVTAADFLRAWRRILDPFTKSEWSWIFRSIDGCATITDNSARAEGFSDLYHGLDDLKRLNPNGIPGDSITSLLEDTGVRPFLEGIRKRSVKRMLEWEEDKLFMPEMTDAVIDELKKARREHKGLWEDAFEAFGKKGSGACAPDEHTLVVRTRGDVPFLPELLARAAFAPLHKSYEDKRGQAFRAGDFVNNGPFHLKGRGPRPPEDEADKRITSVVELERNPKYDGPNPAQVDRVMCYTDQTLQVSAADTLEKMEDVRLFTMHKLDLVYCTWPEYPRKDRPHGNKKPKNAIDLRAAIEKLPGWTVRPAPRVIYLRFRCDRAPFQSRDARKAFALAIDRKELADQYWPKARPAFRFVPDGIDGRVDGVRGSDTDYAAAKAAFQGAGMNKDTWVELSFGESPGQGDVADLLIQGWKAQLGIEPGKRIEVDSDVRRVLRAGRYQAMVADYRGFVDDPYGYLAPLHSADADSGLGWHDEAFDALVDAARDPDVAIAGGSDWVTKCGQPGLAAAVAAAKGSQEGRNRLRHEVLAAAERRLLDEYVVVPLLFLDEAVLVGPGVSGLDGEASLRNPAFPGSLIHVRVQR